MGTLRSRSVALLTVASVLSVLVLFVGYSPNKTDVPRRFNSAAQNAAPSAPPQLNCPGGVPFRPEPRKWKSAAECLGQYKTGLDQGSGDGLANFEERLGSAQRLPKSRYETMKMVYQHFETHDGKVIVEVGTSRSFRAAGPGVNNDDVCYWTPNEPKLWDWGAGAFTRVTAECLAHQVSSFTTVDLSANHIGRSRWMTQEFPFMHYVVESSEVFFRDYDGPPIDLLYLDTGDMNPIWFTAQLHLEEAKRLVERPAILSKDAIILIDDVRNQSPFHTINLKEFGAPKNEYGKSAYSIPYFKKQGFITLAEEYQWVFIPPQSPKQYSNTIPHYFTFVLLGAWAEIMQNGFLMSRKACGFDRLTPYLKAIHDNIAVTLSSNGVSWEAPDAARFYRLLGDAECLSIIKAYEAEWLQTTTPGPLQKFYQETTDLRFKSDVCRLVALSKTGGYYIDADQKPLSGFVDYLTPGVEFIGVLTDERKERHTRVAMPVGVGNLEGVRQANGLMGMTPGHPFIRRNLELIVESYRRDPTFAEGLGPPLAHQATTELASQLGNGKSYWFVESPNVEGDPNHDPIPFQGGGADCQFVMFDQPSKEPIFYTRVYVEGHSC